jgi:hypothetical protein
MKRGILTFRASETHLGTSASVRLFSATINLLLSHPAWLNFGETLLGVGWVSTHFSMQLQIGSVCETRFLD